MLEKREKYCPCSEVALLSQKSKFESVYLACAGGIEPPSIHTFSVTYCEKHTKPTPLTAFQTIFGKFHLLA